MVQWPIALKDVLDELVNTFEEVNATPSTLEHFALYRLHESHLAASNGATTGRYLRVLLSRAQSSLTPATRLSTWQVRQWPRTTF